MLNSGINFTFSIAMGKKCRQNRLKIEKLSFCAKLKAFADRFFKTNISAQTNTKKNHFN